MAGNLLQMGKILVVAGRGRVEAYLGEDHYREQLEYARKNPNDASARLEAGHLCLGREQFMDAVDHLSEALRLSPKVGAPGARDIGLEARQLLFQAYTRLAELAVGSRDLAGADAYFRKALGAAPEGRLRFTGTLNLARHAGTREQWDEATRFLRSILESYPEYPVESGSLTVAAHLFAQHEIGVILRSQGREHYRPYEEQAAALLERAAHQDWAVRCRELLRRFPNSLAAREALVVLGTTALKEGPVRSAVRYWRQLGRMEPEHAGLVAGAHLAACYAKLGQTLKAKRLIDRLKIRYGSRLFRFLDEDASFREFGKQLFASLAEVRPSSAQAEFGLPLKQSWHTESGEVNVVLLSEVVDRETTAEPWKAVSHDRSVLFGGRGGLVSVEAEGGRVRWRHHRRQVGQPWLGIQFGGFGESPYPRVGQVIDLPAWRAGLKTGDLILQIGDKPMEDPNQLVDAIKGSPLNAELPIHIQRGEERLTLKARLASRPENTKLAGVSGRIAVIGGIGELSGIDLRDGKRAWTRSVGDLDDETVFPSDRAGVIRWRVGTHTRARPPLTANSDSSALGLMAINILHKRLLLLDTLDGSISWQSAMEGELLGAPFLTEDVVLTFERSNRGAARLVARDVSDGKMLHELVLGVTEVNPLRGFASDRTGAHYVFVEGVLKKRADRSAQVIWSYDFAGQHPRQIHAAGGRVLVVTANNCLYAFNGVSGNLLWKRTPPVGKESIEELLLSEERLFVFASDGRIVSLGVSTGSSEWQRDPQSVIMNPASKPELAGDYLFVPTGPVAADRQALTTRVAIFLAPVGELRQELSVPGQLLFSRFVGGTYVVLTTDGAYGFRPAPLPGGQVN